LNNFILGESGVLISVTKSPILIHNFTYCGNIRNNNPFMYCTPSSTSPQSNTIESLVNLRKPGNYTLQIKINISSGWPGEQQQSMSFQLYKKHPVKDPSTPFGTTIGTDGYTPNNSGMVYTITGITGSGFNINVITKSGYTKTFDVTFTVEECDLIYPDFYNEGSKVMSLFLYGWVNSGDDRGAGSNSIYSFGISYDGKV